MTKEMTIRRIRNKGGYFSIELPSKWSREHLKNISYIVVETSDGFLTIRPLEV